MRILAIETSCDETAISLLETEGGQSFALLAHEVSSQIDVHKEWGGVVPMLAKREHLINLPLLLSKVIPEGSPAPDLIAVTYGPGLEPALWTGITFAQDLGRKWNVPIIPTDHMAGHIASAALKLMANGKLQMVNVELPAIALLLSGAHTQLVVVKESESYEVVGNTRDDAVGEAFDKVARMLGLRYPGGPEISKLASKFVPTPNVKHRMLNTNETSIQLPRPMIHSKDLDFSFSGLKTAVLYLVKKLKEENAQEGGQGGEGELTEEQKIEISYEFEQAVTEVIVKKTRAAIEQYGAKSLVVGGGVIANKTLRAALTAMAEEEKIELHLPDMKFVTDNATMIGIAGYLRSKGGTVNLLSPATPAFDALRAIGNLSLYK